MTDDTRDAVKAAFAADPRRLIDALGLTVDERKSKRGNGRALWVYDGAEDDASLQVNGKPGMEGLCHRYGDGWSGDCFELVRRYRPGDSFKTRAEFVAHVYGIDTEDRKREPRKQAAVIAETSYPVPDSEGNVLAVHRRQDTEGGGKRMWWSRPDGTHGLPEGVTLASLPLWRAWALADEPRKAIIVCEGEKDADACAEQGLLAVGTYGAEAVPCDAALAPLVGRKVFLWPDNDAPGRAHMDAIAAALDTLGGECFVLAWANAPAKAGAADFFAIGNTADDLRVIAKLATKWEPPATDPEAVRMAEAVNAVPHTTETFKGAKPIEQHAGRIIDLVDERRMRPRKIYGMRTGWPTLDWHFLGFRDQGLVLVCAESGAGKTTIGRHMIFATAEAIVRENLGTRLLVYVLEGGSEQFLRYYAGWKYGIPLSLLEPGGNDRLDEHWSEMLVAAYAEFPTLPIDLCEDLRDADRILWDIERRAQEAPIEGVVLDNVQKLQYESGQLWVNNKRTADKALDIADKLRFPFVALSQVNRDNKGVVSARYGPEWWENATAVFVAERGESGDKREQRMQSNKMTIYNMKQRYLRSCCQPIVLLGDRETGRLFEEETAHAPGTNGERQEGREWPGNG